MPHPDYKEIYNSPKSPGHVLDTFWRLRHNLEIIGDFANGIEENLILEGVSGTALTAGDYVYVSASNTVSRAQANAAGTSEMVGVALSTVGVGVAIRFQLTGVVEIVGWGLTVGALYYLSAAVAGGKTVTAPSGAGEYVVIAGRAITSEKFTLQIDQGVLL